jgi:hypothetical protein
VKNHVTAILRELGVSNRVEAVLAAGALGWKPPAADRRAPPQKPEVLAGRVSAALPLLTWRVRTSPVPGRQPMTPMDFELSALTEPSLARRRANSCSVIDPDFLSRSSFSISSATL